MPLRLEVANSVQRQRFDHDAGPLEFGRGPQREMKRCLIDGDPTVSRDQLRVEERPGGRVRVENLSQRIAVIVSGRGRIPELQSQELEPPLMLTMGQTRLSIELVPSGEVGLKVTVPPEATTAISLPPGLVSIPAPVQSPHSASPSWDRSSSSAGSTVEQIRLWLQRVIELQETGAESPEFYGKTARALVDLVDMDLGLVLLQRDGAWSIAGSAVASDTISVHYSKTLLNHVVAQRKTFYEDLNQLGGATSSLADLESGVASPIFGLREDVVGVLYGVRVQQGLVTRGGIKPLEAQLVQLLAAAVGANLARSMAQRTRVQFEQFFSPDLARELERDTKLLEGRSEEVTILFSDLRGFTALSERLGAHKTCHMLRDMMERLSERIVEYGGVIVDYAGDGILAMWNAPVKQADHAVRACRAALAMLGELPALNARWGDEAAGSLALGIGINTGEALVGNTGSKRKFKYGPHGHPVNLASRVQDATKKLGLPLLITASTRDRLPATLLTRRIGRVVLPGVREPVVAYELFGEHGSPEWLDRRDTYETALTLFEGGQWSRACQALMPLLDSEGQRTVYDTPTLKLMRRAWECLETRPDPFDPIIEVSTK
ncbi:MAG: adenylate/guanylate cyclase domain-containing protein [Thermoguttaceae bacterium]|jgi:adenylate cyclase